jgi:hypothetical protein
LGCTASSCAVYRLKRNDEVLGCTKTSCQVYRLPRVDDVLGCTETECAVYRLKSIAWRELMRLLPAPRNPAVYCVCRGPRIEPPALLGNAGVSLEILSAISNSLINGKAFRYFELCAQQIQ